MSLNKYGVQVGQLWRDEDPRRRLRMVEVVEVGEVYAVVEERRTKKGEMCEEGNRQKSEILLSRFFPSAGNSGYSKVSEGLWYAD